MRTSLFQPRTQSQRSALKRLLRLTLLLALAGSLAACTSSVPGGTEAGEQEIALYFYNPDLDLDASSNIQCSRAGLAPVQRSVPASLSGGTLIRKSIELLLAGGLTPEEQAQGLTTEFPLEGLTLEDVSQDDGVVTLTFSDPNHQTSGGACRTGILWAQIEATGLQFPGVSEVRFQPEELFQP